MKNRDQHNTHNKLLTLELKRVAKILFKNEMLRGIYNE